MDGGCGESLKEAGSLVQAIEDTRHKSITSREWEFLELLSKGLSNAEIAKKLFLTSRTIEDRSIKVYAKLGFSHNPCISPRVLAALWYWGLNGVKNEN